MNSRLIQSTERKQQVRNNLYSAMELIKDEDYHYYIDTTLRFDLFGNKKDSVQIHQRMWGLFKNVNVKSWIGKEQKEQSFLLGTTLNDTLNTTALYVENHFNPLVLAQKTDVIGNSYVPYKRVKTASIGGKNFSGVVIPEKNLFQSDSLMPNFQTNLLVQIKKMQAGMWSARDSTVEMNQLPIKEKRSFFNARKIYQDAESVYLDNRNLRGNIIINSSKEIIISKNCQLKQVICIAPKITIQQNAKMESVQLFAEDTIILEKNVQLNYPSILCVANNKPDSTLLLFEEGVSLSGACIYLNYAKAEASRKTNITIDCKKGSTVQGVLFNQNNTSLQGKVEGNVFTARFMHINAGTYFENYLVNADINLGKRPIHFVYPFMLDSIKQYKLVEWLN